MKTLLERLSQKNTLSPEFIQEFSQHLNVLEVKEGDVVLHHGKTCRFLFYIEKGSLRSFFEREAEEITHWFSFEGDFCCSFVSFIQQKPSYESLVAMEETKLYTLSFEALEKLYAQFPEMNAIVRKIQEEYYAKLEERFVSQYYADAYTRYQQLMKQHPHFLNRIALRHIASYLGISQETLSRIRAKVR